MKKSRKIITLVLFVVVNISMNVFAQQSYREKYSNVLNHYAMNDGDSLKLKAAMFLIDNMDGHVSPDGAAVEEYVSRMKVMKKTAGIRQLQAEWYAALKKGSVINVPDSAVVSDSYLS